MPKGVWENWKRVAEVCQNLTENMPKDLKQMLPIMPECVRACSHTHTHIAFRTGMGIPAVLPKQIVQVRVWYAILSHCATPHPYLLSYYEMVS